MGSPITRPRLILNDAGRVVRKVKRGIGPHTAHGGPHVQYFAAGGARVDHIGRAVEARARDNFRPVQWDLPEEEEAPPAPLDIEAALTLARRSPTFRARLDEVLRAGWTVEVASAMSGAGVRRGAHRVALDTSRRDALVARMVHDVALAAAYEAPDSPAFPVAATSLRELALGVMRLAARAALDHALVRDEVLLTGGADIGGPGLRGLQIEAYDVARRQSVAADRVLDAIAFSVDGTMARNFSSEGGPLVLRQLTAAFAAPSVVTGALPPDISRALEGLRRLPRLDAATVGQHFGVQLAPRPVAVETGHVDLLSAATETGPFSLLELTLPVLDRPRPTPLAPRLLLVPRYPVSQLEMSGWYGLGTPHHLDLGEAPLATSAHEFDQRTLLTTYRASDDRLVRFFTVHGD